MGTRSQMVAVTRRYLEINAAFYLTVGVTILVSAQLVFVPIRLARESLDGNQSSPGFIWPVRGCCSAIGLGCHRLPPVAPKLTVATQFPGVTSEETEAMTLVKSLVGAAMFGYAVRLHSAGRLQQLLCGLTLAVRSLASDELHHRGGRNHLGSSSLRAQAAPEARHTSRARNGGVGRVLHHPGAGHLVLHRLVQTPPVERRRVRQRVRQHDLVPGVSTHPLCSRNNRGFTLEVGPP